MAVGSSNVEGIQLLFIQDLRCAIICPQEFRFSAWYQILDHTDPTSHNSQKGVTA